MVSICLYLILVLYTSTSNLIHARLHYNAKYLVWKWRVIAMSATLVGCLLLIMRE